MYMCLCLCMCGLHILISNDSYGKEQKQLRSRRIVISKIFMNCCILYLCYGVCGMFNGCFIFNLSMTIYTFHWILNALYLKLKYFSSLLSTQDKMEIFPNDLIDLTLIFLEWSKELLKSAGKRMEKFLSNEHILVGLSISR